MLRRIAAALEAQTGWVGAIDRRLTAPVPFSLGRALLPAIVAVTVLEALTGVGLALHYAPTATDAWPSVLRIESAVTMGSLLRGAHAAGTVALLVLCGLAVAHGLATAAWRGRSFAWLGLLGLLAVLPLFPMTGNLLPWDETGYYQTAIEASIVGNMPGVGSLGRAVLVGGPEINSATLTRYNALHTLVLPLLFALPLILAWSGRRVRAADGAEDKAAPYFPRQYTVELLTAALVVAAVFAAGALMPAPLDAPADPTRAIDARPEWYFMPLYALRKAMEGPYEVVGTALIPGLLLGLLAALPVLDPQGRRRWVFAGVLALAVGGMGAMAGSVMAHDRDNADHQKDVAAVALRGQLAREYAAVTPPGVDGNVPLFEGLGLFVQESCGECHSSRLGTTAKPKAPDLRGYMSRPWLARFLDNPSHPAHFGATKLDYSEDAGTGMPAYASLDAQKKTDVVEFLVSQGGSADAASAERGKAVFESECSGCHELDGSASNGPHLKGFGSVDWIADIILQASHESRYGELGKDMPDFPHLDVAQRRAIAAWLLHEGASGTLN